MRTGRDRRAGNAEARLGGLVFVLCALAVVGMNAARDAADPPGRAVEDDLAAFGRAQIPGLQRLIEDLAGWADQGDDRCRRLASELTRLGRDPAADPDYAAWRRQADDLRAGLAAARRQREDLYLEYRKAELAPAGRDAFQKRLADARAECDRTAAKFRQVAAEKRRLEQ